MGLFDTFVINPPVECPECKCAISSVQSKAFGQSLERYQPGTLVNQSEIRYGIIEEECYCQKCTYHKDIKRTVVYLLIWHNVYVGAYDSEKKALKKLNSIDRLNILEWLDKTQREKELWQCRFSNIYNEIRELHDYETSDNKEEYLKKPFNTNNFKKYLEQDDPLAALLAENDFYMENTTDEIFG